jgi:thioredoxin 1
MAQAIHAMPSMSMAATGTLRADGHKAHSHGGKHRSGAGLKYLRTKKEFETSLAFHPLLVVDYTATWCGPCKSIAPKFEELSKVHKTIAFRKVDVDENPDASQWAGVQAMPTFVIYRKGVKQEEVRGANPQKLEELLKKYA